MILEIDNILISTIFISILFLKFHVLKIERNLLGHLFSVL